eukprot:15465759-Alexandrium_andersonii.AAC.1
MRVVLKPPQDLKRREFNFINSISQDDEADQSRGGNFAGLFSEETMSHEQWVDKVVSELKEAALK